MQGMGKLVSTMSITQIPANGKVLRDPQEFLISQRPGNPALSPDSFSSSGTQTQAPEQGSSCSK